MPDALAREMSAESAAVAAAGLSAHQATSPFSPKPRPPATAVAPLAGRPAEGAGGQPTAGLALVLPTMPTDALGLGAPPLARKRRIYIAISHHVNKDVKL